MTGIPEDITVECPRCAHEFEDWCRSLNLDLEHFDEAYQREASTATCPACGFVAELDTLVVEEGVWRFTGSRSGT